MFIQFYRLQININARYYLLLIYLCFFTTVNFNHALSEINNSSLLAKDVNNKSKINRKSLHEIPIKKNIIVIRPKLNVQILSGEFEKWGDSVTVQTPDLMTFRWAYYGSAAKSAEWQLSDIPFDSDNKPALFEKGLINYIPEYGKFGLFKIKLSNYLPPKPFSYPSNYYVRIITLNEKMTSIESPSSPVTITYRKPHAITKFHPYEFDEKMQTKRFKPYYKIRIHAIRTADTNGVYSAKITAEEIRTMVDKANLAWWLSGIEFLFDPKNDFEHINLTQLNRVYSLEDHILLYNLNLKNPLKEDLKPYQTDSYKEYDKIKKSFADKYKNKFVLIFHYGSSYTKETEETNFKYVPDRLQSSYHSPSNKNYLLVPGYINELASHRRSPIINSYYFAHRLGHFFGLYDVHIYSHIVFLDQASEALKNAIEAGQVPAYNASSLFDNDKSTVSDTPPDLGIAFFDRNSNQGPCVLDTTIKIPVNLKKGYVYYDLKPDKLNLMSNFLGCKNGIPHLSIGQIKRTRNAIENGNRKHLDIKL